MIYLLLWGILIMGLFRKKNKNSNKKSKLKISAIPFFDRGFLFINASYFLILLHWTLGAVFNLFGDHIANLYQYGVMLAIVFTFNLLYIVFLTNCPLFDESMGYTSYSPEKHSSLFLYSFTYPIEEKRIMKRIQGDKIITKPMNDVNQEKTESNIKCQSIVFLAKEHTNLLKERLVKPYNKLIYKTKLSNDSAKNVFL